MFNNVGVRTELITVKDYLADGGEGILMCLHFFLLDIVVVFVVSVILVDEIGTRGVVNEAFVPGCALVVVAVRVLEVDAAAGNHCEVFWNGRNI